MAFTFVFQVPGKVVMGSTIDPLSTLPRANKIDPSVSHTAIFTRLKVMLKAQVFLFTLHTRRHLIIMMPPVI